MFITVDAERSNILTKKAITIIGHFQVTHPEGLKKWTRIFTNLFLNSKLN